MNEFSYIPGIKPLNPGPLTRFLPPLEEGVSSAWLETHVDLGAWVLDPFGSSPQQAIRTARKGYRVLVAANNPVARFMLEMAADPPSTSDYNAALAELAVSLKGKERLESHLKNLYKTQCANCQQMVIAESFLWHKDAATPFARIYECKSCGDKGERLTTVADAERALELLSSAKLHRARVLERIAPLNNPDREYAEEALQSYLPRAIYVLTTLINRLDGLSLSPLRQRALTALLLTACDEGNTLWPHPVERPRPKQLFVPGQFYEHNLWLALEQGVDMWASDADPVPLNIWPDPLPESGGVCLFEGKLKELNEKKKLPRIEAVITTIPRPNQAFWTLSALWAGWLWGREAAQPFKVGLRRRRYDWGWHATALHAAFGHLATLLPKKTPLLGLLAEPEPSFLSATLAAASSDFTLKNLAMRTKYDPVQIIWEREEPGEMKKPQVGGAVKKYLRARGEATTYLHLHALALTEFARANSLLLPQEAVDETLHRIHATIDETLNTDTDLLRYEGSEHSLQTGFWGLASTEKSEIPLPDRAEMAVVRYLSKNPRQSLFEIEREIYPQFAGLETPSKALILAILDSYAHHHNDGFWHLREEDKPSARLTDLKEMRALITNLGERLGHQTQQIDDKMIVWGEESAPVYVFHLIASARVREILDKNTPLPGRNLIVLPGGRAGLLAYKEKRDPTFRASLRGWRVIKFRLLRTLSKIPLLNAQTWEEQIGSDPIEGPPSGQLMMF